MSKLKKILLGSAVGLLVLIIVAVIVFGLFLGKIVKTGVNTVGPKLTQTTLTVDAVDLSLLAGSVNVKGLIVGNPDGYKDKSPTAISIGLTAVSVSPMSVLSDKIVVKSIRVESPDITLEGNPLGANNLTKILDNVNAAAKNSVPPAANQTANAAGKPSKKLEVDDLLVTGAKVHFGMGLTLPLPEIHLTDLGTGPEGITSAELTKRILDIVVSDAIKAVAKSAANVGKEATKAVGAGVNKITTGIGGLLKKTTN